MEFLVCDSVSEVNRHDPSGSPGPAAPVAASERIAALDMLRGVALLGIFIMNMPGFTHSLFAQPVPEANAIDRVVVAARDLFFAGKFNLLFGLLFGIGFALQMARLESAGASRPTWVYARRLAALLAIGLVHAVLLWPGDVLVVYAVLGFGLLAIRKLPERALIALLAACLVYPAAADALRPVLLSLQTETVAAFEYEDFRATNDAAFGHGSLLDAAGETARVFAWSYSSPLGLFSYFAFYVQMATGILMGFIVGRRGWPRRLGELGDELRRWHRLALATALLSGATWLGVAATSAEPVGLLVVFVLGLAKTIGRAALSIVYALAVVRLLQWRPEAAWTRSFERAGHMPLSNYLLQTLMASVVFYGWGLGFWGRVGPAQETLLAIALFVLVQLPLSAMWLGRFRYGPIEYLWRLVTYGRRAL